MIDRETNVARFRASSEMIAWAWAMPEGTKVSNIRLIDPVNMIYEVIVIHPDLPPIPAGGEVPEIFPATTFGTEEELEPADILEWHWNLDGELR